MKKIRNLLFVVCLLISLGVFTSCKKKVETSGTGYGIVHKDYVGVASIKVKDEKVTSLSFEEVYLPENWAQVSDSIDENLYFKATGSHGDIPFHDGYSDVHQSNASTVGGSAGIP